MAEAARDLHSAAAAGHEERVRELLAAGADVHEPVPPVQETPLHAAASNGRERVVEALLAAGANPRALNLSGHTPLMLAAGGGHASCSLPLLAAGDTSGVEGANCWICMHHWAIWAAKHPDSDRALQTLHALLDAGCDAAHATPKVGTALNRLLSLHLRYARESGQQLTHVPEMVR